MAIKRRSVDETPSRGGGGDRKPSMRDLLPQIEWPKGAKYVRGRLFPGVVAVGYHDYKLFRKDGTAVMNERYGKQSSVPKMCLSFDPATGEHDPDKTCPYCDHNVYFKIDYWAEAIIEELVDKLPAKNKPSREETKSGFKDKDNESSATPVRPIRWTNKVFDRVKGLKQLNKVVIDGEKVPVSVDDEDNGCWINMNYDENGTGDGMYGLQKDERQALSEIDEDYLRWDIEGAHAACVESIEEAKRNVEWLKKHSDNADSGSDDGDDGYSEGDYVKFVTDEDETVTGTITKMTDTKVTIEDDDGDERTFRWKEIESHERVKKPGSKDKGKASSKAKGDDDEYEPEEGDYVQVLDSDGDEVGKGPVDEVGSRAITVAGEVYKISTHTFVKGKAPAKGSKAKAEPEPEPDEYEPEEGDYVKVMDMDDDEVAAGEVEETDAKSVTVGGTPYRRAKHTFVKSKAPAKAGKAKAAPEPDPDDEYEPEEGDYIKVLDIDEDVVVEGEVEETDAKTVTVDGTPYRRAKHTFVKGKAPAKGGKAKAAPEPDQEEEEFSEGDYVKVLDSDEDVLVEGKVTDIDAKSVTVEDADSEEHTYKLAKVTLAAGKKPKASAKAPAKKKGDDDDEGTPTRGKSQRSYNFDDD